MATESLISVEEYLATSYRPDVDYVDGEIVERNVGERDHGLLQMWFGIWARKLRQAHGLWAISEQRIQLGTNRYRIPDVCVTLGRPAETVLTSPPLIVVEILSPTDTLSRVAERVEDYLAFGVPHVWVVDPARREAYECAPDGFRRVDALETKEPHLVLPLSELFADLD